MRVVDFSDGFTSAGAPSAGTTKTITNTRASPGSITAAGGISPAGVAEETIFVQGSGGAIDITKNPQIAVGTATGQKLRLIGRSDTNTLFLENGTGLALNGSCLLVADSVLDLEYDGSVWLETGRNGI